MLIIYIGMVFLPSNMVDVPLGQEKMRFYRQI